MTASAFTPVTFSSSRVQTNQVITTDGGIELVADLYIPAGTPPFPAIVEITPYSAQQQKILAEIYAIRGYLFLAVDARGRYRSSGEWQPMANDQSDGHKVIEWLAAHPLCNGRIGSRGHSYCGYNQLLTAIKAPPALQAMVVCVAPGDPFSNVPFHGGAYDMSDFMWLLSMTGRECGDEGGNEYLGIKRFGAEEFEENPYESEQQEDDSALTEFEQKKQQAQRDNLAAALSSRPFCEMDLRFGIRQPQFREWLQHWQFDGYWQQRSVLPHLHETDVATLYISGWWDNNGRGATAFYRGMREHAASPANRENQRLLMGAWTHALQAPECGDLTQEETGLISRAAQRDELNDEFAWFDQHLMDIKPGPAAAARTSLYITGLHQWLDFTDWPPVETQISSYYLGAADNSKQGRLLSAASDGPRTVSSYTFNPEDPTPFSAHDILAEKAPFNNAELQQQRDDILVFDTPVFDSPLALVGEIAAVIYASSDAVDFDLCAKLLDVYPDGRAIYLADGIIRARFRHGMQQAVKVAANEVNVYHIDLWHIGHVLRRGHALRLEITSAALGRFDINPCTGADLATETGCQQANISIYHSSKHPSQLQLPVCRDARLIQGSA